MSPQTKETLEKAAYTAVGAPIAAVKALSARLADLRETIMESRSDLSEDLAKEFDSWVAEGERVVGKVLERIRQSGTAEQARVASEQMRERVSKTVEEMRSEMDQALDIVEPEETLETIKGIGPGYAQRFNQAGIAGINAFMVKTQTKEDLQAVASETGFSTDQIADWRDRADLTRVKGVGESYLDLLHRSEIWTVEQFADADAAMIAERIQKLDIPGMPEQLPGEDQISNWIREAKKLAAS